MNHPLWVMRVVLGLRRRLPLYPDRPIMSVQLRTSLDGHFRTLSLPDIIEGYHPHSP